MMQVFEVQNDSGSTLPEEIAYIDQKMAVAVCGSHRHGGQFSS